MTQDQLQQILDAIGRLQKVIEDRFQTPFTFAPTRPDYSDERYWVRPIEFPPLQQPYQTTPYVPDTTQYPTKPTIE